MKREGNRVKETTLRIKRGERNRRFSCWESMHRFHLSCAYPVRCHLQSRDVARGTRDRLRARRAAAGWGLVTWPPERGLSHGRRSGARCAAVGWGLVTWLTEQGSLRGCLPGACLHGHQPGARRVAAGVGLVARPPAGYPLTLPVAVSLSHDRWLGARLVAARSSTTRNPVRRDSDKRVKKAGIYWIDSLPPP